MLTTLESQVESWEFIFIFVTFVNFAIRIYVFLDYKKRVLFRESFIVKYLRVK